MEILQTSGKLPLYFDLQMKVFFLTILCTLICLTTQGVVCAQNMEKETVVIPGTRVSFEMVLLPGGTFMMGSKPEERFRENNEGYHEVTLDGFWMGKCEVTWNEFYCFQFKHMDNDSSQENSGFQADAVARPTPPYFDFTYGRGRAGGFPAATMTQQAALRYCQWLSDKTGDFYRLPTEAEWEYACRAGSESAFSWGDNSEEAERHAWLYSNSSGSYQKVASKAPNAWGLYDMHGNVAEWTLDFYTDQYFAVLDSSSVNPVIMPTKKHSRTVKGGGFEDYPGQARCAYRKKSDPKWQARDPQIPKSKWWNPDSPFVGFRVVKETKKLSKEDRDAFFNLMIKD